MKFINVKVFHGKGSISEESGFIRVYTMEPRENNRANLDVMKQISKYYNVPSTGVEIVSGWRSKNKMVEIDV
jgi:uncharacterized protein YggU (UPF0235/DUF167 family)